MFFYDVESIYLFSVSGGGSENPKLLFHSFGKYFKASDMQPDFDVLPCIDGDRVQKKRLQAIHRVSGIRCWIECDSNPDITESSQMIRNCIAHSPICK